MHLSGSRSQSTNLPLLTVEEQISEQRTKIVSANFGNTFGGKENYIPPQDEAWQFN